MTNSEAIKYGKEQLEIFGGKHAEFIRMAIEALEALTNTNNALKSLDCIGRQDAIDAIKTAEVNFTVRSDINFADYQKTVQDIFNNVLYAHEQVLKRLPSAQPEIIRCKDCKHYQGEDSWLHCNRVTWFNGEDDFCSRAERKDNG